MPWRRTVPRRILWQHSFQPISSARRACGPGWHWPRCFSPQRSGCAAIRDQSESLEDWTPFRTHGGKSMNTAVMTERIAETSPRLKARITGVFYLLTILTGIFAQGFVSERLVVDGDAAATATNILAHKSLFQLGYAVYLIEMACNIAMTALFYDLLKPAGRSVSLVAAFLGFAGCVIKTFSRAFFIVPLFVLGGAHDLSVFSAEQLQALALLFLKVNDHGAAIALVFFGFYAPLTGYLLNRSTFLPRILGVLSVFGGSGSGATLSPAVSVIPFSCTTAFGLLGAASLIL